MKVLELAMGVLRAELRTNTAAATRSGCIEWARRWGVLNGTLEGPLRGYNQVASRDDKAI